MHPWVYSLCCHLLCWQHRVILVPTIHASLRLIGFHHDYEIVPCGCVEELDFDLSSKWLFMGGITNSDSHNSHVITKAEQRVVPMKFWMHEEMLLWCLISVHCLLTVNQAFMLCQMILACIRLFEKEEFPYSLPSDVLMLETRLSVSFKYLACVRSELTLLVVFIKDEQNMST